MNSDLFVAASSIDDQLSPSFFFAAARGSVRGTDQGKAVDPIVHWSVPRTLLAACSAALQRNADWALCAPVRRHTLCTLAVSLRTAGVGRRASSLHDEGLCHYKKDAENS